MSLQLIKNTISNLSKRYKQKDITYCQCNKCGKKISKNNYEGLNLMHLFKISFKYGSKYDMEQWNYNLCEDCLLELISSFIIPPEILDYNVW